MTNSVLAKLAVQISANTAEFNKNLSATQRSLTSFVGNVSKIAGTVGVAFSVQQVANFALEITKLAGEAQGVEAAFKRLPNSTRLMEQLKEATGGTVSELGLMKRAVQASNFDISLEALPKLLEFATLRAQQTGQSVDYLVDSIVTGIGRKSKLILDNLGISAVQLNEALGGVTTGVASIGDVADAVGKIASDNLSKMAGFSENAATKTQRLAAEWENFKIQLGEGSDNVGLIADGIDNLTLLLKNLSTFLSSDGASVLWDYLRLVTLVPRKTMDAANAVLEYANAQSTLSAAVEDFNERFSNKPLAGLGDDAEEFNAAIADMGKKAEKEGKKIVLLRDEFDNVVAVIKPFNETVRTLTADTEEQIITYQALKDKLTELNTQFEETDVNDQKKLLNIGNQIIATNKQIEAIEKLRKAEKEKNKFDKMDAAFFQMDRGTVFGEGAKSGGDFLESIGLDPKDIEEKLDAAGRAVSRFGLVVRSAQKEMIDLTPNVVSAISGIGQALGSAISGSIKLRDALLSVLGNVLVQLGEMLVTTGIGIIAFKKSLITLNGPLAIGAGIALITMGAYVSGSIKKLGKDAGSSGSSGSGLRSEFDPARFSGSSSVQDSNPRLITVIKGSDLWIALENYQRGRVTTG